MLGVAGKVTMIPDYAFDVRKRRFLSKKAPSIVGTSDSNQDG